MYKQFIKRILDLIFSLGAFMLLFPVFLLISVLLLLFNKGTPYFTQARPGKNEKLFRVIKFKTMNDKRDDRGELLSDEQRLTFIGKLVRKTSLDELPQLLNVLAGDMSLIGPRPLLPEYLALYDAEQKKRHMVRPGITGWAQIHGRNALSWKEKFEYDVWYVENLSFYLDMKILATTVSKVIKAEGISGKGVSTAEKFNGHN